MSDNGEPSEDQVQPSIVITFAAHQSAEIHVAVTDCSPFQMWGAARLLEQYASDQWQAIQMQQAMQQANQQIVPVRSFPGDHLVKGARRQ